MSQITTHVLDTSIGKPANGVAVFLEQFISGDWNQIGEGITTDDGRLDNLLSSYKILDTGIYRLVFDTQSYFKTKNIKSFYPKVRIEFEVTDVMHYHIPLLLSPFGYSTYRGS